MSSPAGSRLVSVDVLRAVAALLVLFAHSPLSANSLPDGVRFWALLPHTYGGFGLSLFIVLSGFCIHLPTARRMAAGQPARADWGAFWGRRFFRLYPPYAVAVALSVAVYYATGPDNYPPDARVTSLTPDLIAHAMMVHNLFRDFCESLGNGALWSLGLEEQLYALYAVMLFLRRRLSAGRTLVITLAVSFAWQVGLRWILGIGTWGDGPTWPEGPLALGRWMQWPFAWWFLWTLGAVAAEHHAAVARLPGWCASWACVGVAAVAAVVTSGEFSEHVLHRAGPSPLFGVSELLWGAVAFALLNRFVRSEIAGGFRGRLASWFARLGVMSYSLYLVHLPVLAVVRFTLGPAVSPVGVLIRFIAAIGGSLVFAVLFFFAVERWFLKPWKRRSV